MTNGDDQTDRQGKKPSEQIAIALDYEIGGKDAPVVVAGGRGAIAEQILEIAFANDVKVREDADLAQLLSTIDIESEIPLEAFAAVAEILVYVYKANGTKLPTDSPEDTDNTADRTESGLKGEKND